MKSDMKVLALVVFIAVAGFFAFLWVESREKSSATQNNKMTATAQNSRLKTRQPVLTNCLSAELAAGASIIVLGAYGGRADASTELNADNHKIGQINLTAAETGPPIILIVSAYDPITWNFSQAPSNRIRAVLATGYYDQNIEGLAASVPVRMNSYSTPDARCGRFSYAYKGGLELDELVRTIQMIFGREPDSFQGSYKTGSFAIDGDGASGSSK